MSTTVLTALALLTACGEPEPDSFTSGADGADDTGALEDTDGGGSDAVELLSEYSGGDCPVIVDGDNEGFLSGGVERALRVAMPDDPVGAGVAFSWHWLGGTGQQTLDWLPYDEQANADDVIVIAPDSAGSAYEWLFTEEPEGNIDLILFDDVLTCLYEHYGVDLDRVYAYGMSAGGLMTSYLTIHRADQLAATAPLSGGSDQFSYETPAAQIPVLLTWGGPSDTYYTYSFDDASRYFSQALQDDGHFVIECIHDEGHNIPAESEDYLWPFLSAHTRDLQVEPFDEDLPDYFPEWCAVP
jgi:hypothetical protein